MGLRFFSITLCLALAGCAAPPSFRNVVYEHVSPTARVLEPKGYLPSRAAWAYKANAYRLPPGSIIIPMTSQPSDAFKHVAGSLGNPDTQCLQQSFRIDALRVNEPKRLPINVDYDFELILSSPFAMQNAIDDFKRRHDLVDMPKNVIAFIKKVEFRISNVRAYEVTPEQKKKILADLNTAGCSALQAPLSALVINRAYVGNVRTYVRWDSGYDFTLGMAWKSKVQKSLRDSFDGNNVIFAVETGSSY